MAMGLPVVSTSLGAEGLQVRSGDHLLLADGAEKLAEEVVRLLRSPELRVRLGAAARNLVETQFSSESVARQFESVCRRAVEECCRQ
jgi:glycosyltransferase involved in cell wall biosynthesis